MNLDDKYLTMMRLMLTAEHSPNLREMATACQLTIGAIQSRLEVLRKNGLVTPKPKGNARCNTLTELGKMRLEGPTR